jgi:hypothetical protein
MQLVHKTKSMTRLTRFLSARLPFHMIEIHDPVEDGKRSVIISFRRNNSQAQMGVNLTALTEAELRLFGETVRIAVDLALGSVQARDKKAAEDLENGNVETDERAFRSLPIVVVNQSRIQQYDPELCRRYPNLLQGKSTHNVGNVGAGDPSGGVVETEGEDGLGGDDSTTGSESA